MRTATTLWRIDARDHSTVIPIGGGPFSGRGTKVCSQAGVTTTGTFRCRSQKYAATLTVTDEGVAAW